MVGGRTSINWTQLMIVQALADPWLVYVQCTPFWKPQPTMYYWKSQSPQPLIVVTTGWPCISNVTRTANYPCWWWWSGWIKAENASLIHDDQYVDALAKTLHDEPFGLNACESAIQRGSGCGIRLNLADQLNLTTELNSIHEFFVWMVGIWMRVDNG